MLFLNYAGSAADRSAIKRSVVQTLKCRVHCWRQKSREYILNYREKKTQLLMNIFLFLIANLSVQYSMTMTMKYQTWHEKYFLIYINWPVCQPVCLYFRDNYIIYMYYRPSVTGLEQGFLGYSNQECEIKMSKICPSWTYDIINSDIVLPTSL